ncbi:hypothetical protein IWQ60_007484 [Tieghemiomyces parasiticus]|uniref:Uncharacterized protein n=1 Tax=Tieghemiomyces parasiticus TaxID=78921 RepID=A0A9W8DUL4_9FUNG|nr:hypothetical protein IWQ60_007484 [Tieghemiomyces parasiticus]
MHLACPIVTFLVMIAYHPTTITAESLLQPNKLIDEHGRCLSVTEGDVYVGADLTVEACVTSHPVWQTFRPAPYPFKYDGLYGTFNIEGLCVQGPSLAGNIATLPALTIDACTHDDSQLFQMASADSRLGVPPFQLKHKATGLCVGSAPGGSVVVVDCDLPGNRWTTALLGGTLCDGTVWRRFQQEQWPVAGLMRHVGLDVDHYLETIHRQGIPSLTQTDQALLANCHLDIQHYFDDFDRRNHNMFAKLLNYPSLYSTRVLAATDMAVYMFIQSRLAYRVWQNLSPLAIDFVDQFSMVLALQYPEFSWLTVIGKEVVKKAIRKIDNGNPPELKSWGARIQDIFNESVQLIWDMHVHAINITAHNRYDAYANIYQSNDLRQIFGSEEDVQAQITVLLAKEISKVPAMDGQCCILQYTRDLGGAGDYRDSVTGNRYRVVLPGRSHQMLFTNPLRKFFNVEDIVHSRNGWGLRTFKTISGFGTCTLSF